MNAPTSQPEQAEAVRAAAAKFTYPSGARPLDGYTIKRGIGHGGFGEVYFGTSDAGKEVALKLIRRNLEVELRGVKQCLNLKHPNLIGLYDIREDDHADQWVIMEYVSGEQLDQVVDQYPNGMPQEEVLRWIRGMCAGVAYLHDQGIVHRDLKPGNIFCDQGVVKIGDYGLAKFISCSRRSGQTESVGTVHYMAPEIANGRYGREIDTYALGIILYEMLTGNVPFEGESVGEVLMKHLTAEPNLEPLAEPYRSIVRRALAKDPDARLKSVNEMLAMLPQGGAAPAWSPTPARYVEPALEVTEVFEPTDDPASGNPANVPEEPIFKAMREACIEIRDRWRAWDIKPTNKALLFFVGLVLFSVFFLRLTPISESFLVGAVLVYCVYYVVWAIVLRPGAGDRASHLGRGSPATDGRSPDANRRNAPVRAAGVSRHARRAMRRRLRQSWQDRVHQELAKKPFRQKLSELMGSMILAAIISAMLAVVAPILVATPASERVAIHFWLMLVGTLGSWAILIPTKFAEGRIEDQAPMRSVLLVLGAGLGAAAWGLATFMMFGLPHWRDLGISQNDALMTELIGRSQMTAGTEWFGANSVLPNFPTFVAYFAFLYVLLRWWRLAEYTRRRRVGLWATAWCVFWAWLLHVFWWFPQPAGVMTVGVIAVATQFSSPWLPPSRRRALTEEIQSV